MSVWREQVVPRLSDAMNPPAVVRERVRACAGLAGDIVEIGSGSGRNLAHLPASVTSVTAVEPSRVARRLAARRASDGPVKLRFAGTDAAALPFPDNLFDAALSTLTLCTIDDVEATLGEIHRVLRPGGALHFLEHGLAPDQGVRRWQRRLEPVQKRVFAGCHLTRDIGALLAGSALVVEDLEQEYLPGSPMSRPFAYLSRGRARKAVGAPSVGTPIAGTSARE